MPDLRRCSDALTSLVNKETCDFINTYYLYDLRQISEFIVFYNVVTVVTCLECAVQ